MDNMKRNLDKQLTEYLDLIKKNSKKYYDTKFVAILLLFKYYSSESFQRNEKYKEFINYEDEIFNGSPELILVSEYLNNIQLTDDEIKGLVNLISSKIDSDHHSMFLNNEFYKLVCMLLEIKSNDVVYEVNTLEERFLFNANATVDSEKNVIRLRTLFKPNYEIYADMTEMALIMNNMNYSRVKTKAVLKPLKINKIFINPSYSLLEKNSKVQYNPWDDINDIVDKLEGNNRAIALIPDNYLSRNPDMKFREALLSKRIVEGIISMPFRLLSSDLILNMSLVILRKNVEKIKILNAADIFEIEDVRLIGLDNIINIITDRYLNDDCDFADYKDVILRGAVMTPSNIITEKLYNNTESLKKLEDVAEVMKGHKGTYSTFMDNVTESNDANYYLLTSSDIDNGVIDYGKLTKLIDGSKYEKYFLNEGDLVFTTKSTKVKIAVANNINNKNIIVSGSMMIVRPNTKIINPIYLKMFFESNQGRKILDKIQKGSVTTTITLDDFKSLMIPCPPMEVQRKYVFSYKELQEEYEIKKKELEIIQSKINDLFNALN